MESSSVTSPNIALVKYWGKYHDELILPINDSIGITLNAQDLRTTTKITFSKQTPEDSLILNGTPEPISKRLANILRIAREAGLGTTQIPSEEWPSFHFKIESTNSFPTASGMASSASGLAAIAVCLNNLFKGCFEEKRVSELARLGSGSASRSIYGGLVKWSGIDGYPKQKAEDKELQQISRRCITEQIVSAEKLKCLRVIILLAHENKKQTSSTDGMKRSVETSELIKSRNKMARERVNTIIDSLSNNDFNTFSETIIKDSNTFHAICLDTYPPIHYLNHFSRQVMSLVDWTINPHINPKVAYTFDAGPHAFIIAHESVFSRVFKFLLECYKVQDHQLNQKGLKLRGSLDEGKCDIQIPTTEMIRPVKMWVTDVGKGPMDKE